MSLTRWPGERFGLSVLQRDLNRLFEEVFRGGAGFPRGEADWGPPIDVTETPETLVVEAELPGVDPKNVEVSVIGDTLSIRGKKESNKETKDAQRHLMERTCGSFLRIVKLPTPVAAQDTAAQSKDGILTITLPKSQEAKPRRIQIQSA
jgi:HSP20 family protein